MLLEIDQDEIKKLSTILLWAELKINNNDFYYMQKFLDFKTHIVRMFKNNNEFYSSLFYNNYLKLTKQISTDRYRLFTDTNTQAQSHNKLVQALSSALYVNAKTF